MHPEQRAPATPPPPDAVRAAFHDLHGRRLHGFALLLTLGDRPEAARRAADALAAGGRRVDELRHPERAAAWLRSQVVRAAPRRSAGRRDPDAASDLGDIGADPAVLRGLSALKHAERAALIAASIERLDRRDVAVVVGRDGRALDRLLKRARLRYLDAAPTDAHPVSDGPIAERIHAVARRTLG